MSLQPVDLLRFAKTVDCSTEAACRAALSRAYYCAYHCALPIAKFLPPSPGYELPGHIRHAEVQARLSAWNAPDEWEMAVKKAGDPRVMSRHFKALLVKRKLADYQLGATVEQTEVALQVANADAVNRFFYRLSTELAAAAA